MKWYKIPLTMEQVADGVLLQIHKQFSDLFRKANAPKDAAMFAGGLNEEGETLYFSPASTMFIQSITSQHPGEETEQPSINNVVLLVGRVGDKKRLLK